MGNFALTVQTLTDGRAGNAAQAEGLAEAIARLVPAEIAHTAAPLRRGGALVPALVWHGVGQVAPALLRAAHMGVPGQASLPDLAIGAGRRTAPLLASLGRQGARTVQLLDPGLPASALDLVVVPEHDRLRGPNVLTSLGALGRITPTRIAEAAAELAPRLPCAEAPRLAILVGGPGGMAGWTPEDGTRLLAVLEDLAAHHSLLVTASRRTEAPMVAALERLLDPARHLFYDGRAGENPYPGLLGHTKAVLVTEDSVNMASEAASTGLPVHIFRLERASAKARRFHAALASHGAARDFQGTIAAWSYPPLAEADRLAKATLARLFPNHLPAP
ncbi:MAG: mitochondrial fission ELM1 family protein [Pseudomonadota bacterium]